MQFSFQAAFALGWQTFRSRYGALLGASAVVVFAYFAISVVSNLARLALAPQAPGAVMEPDDFTVAFLLFNSSVDLVLGVFFTVPLSAGVLLLALRHTRAESPPFGAVFAGFSERYGPLAGIGALWIAPSLLVYAPVLLGPSPLFLLLIPVGLVLAARFGLVLLLCMDRRLGVMESYSASWRLTGPDRVFWPLLGILLALLLINALCAALLLLPLIFFGAPLAIAVSAAAYELIAGGAESGGAPAAAP